MKRTLLPAATSVALVASLVLSPSLALAAKSNAPTGTYTASTGGSAGTGHVRGPGGGGIRGRKMGSGAAAGQGITINIGSYSSQADWDALVAAQQSGGGKAVLDSLSGMNHGSVQIEGQSFPVNAALSVKTGNGWVIHVLSARAFSGEGSRRAGLRAKGVTAGYIRLKVDGGGNGEGMLYTSTQVVVEKNDVAVQGGASTATALTSVSRS